jgi:hypothetical protein
MPLISTLANASARGYGAFGGVAASTTSYESIATTTVGSGGTTTITFSSIPSTYKHLQIRGFVADNATNSNFELSFNGSAGTKAHRLMGDGASATADYYNSAVLYAQRTDTGQFVFITDLLDYTSTTINKTVRTLAGGDNNGAGRVGLWSGFINSTSAITSLSITPSAGNFPQYSSIALYGIKG